MNPNMSEFKNKNLEKAYSAHMTQDLYSNEKLGFCSYAQYLVVKRNNFEF